jgi:Ca-activated chloride channel homolog
MLGLMVGLERICRESAIGLALAVAAAMGLACAAAGCASSSSSSSSSGEDEPDRVCEVEGKVSELVSTHEIALEVAEGADCLKTIADDPTSIRVRVAADEREVEVDQRIRGTVSSRAGGLALSAVREASAEPAQIATSAPRREFDCPDGEVDDWTPFERFRDRGPRRAVGAPPSPAPMAEAPMGSGAGIGLAAGGAKDANNFRNNIEEGYVPLPQGIRYEGLFYDHRFAVGDGQACDKLFCPTFDAAVSPHPITGDKEHFVAVGLSSGLERVERPPLNVTVVLDVSGSMGSSFSQYYYDQFGTRHEVEDATDSSKMAVAREVLQTLTEQLRPDDLLGIVLFNNQAHTVKPLRPVACTDMDAIRSHIAELEQGGGTNMEAGMRAAKQMYDGLDADVRAHPRSSRIVFLADAMPNIGDTSADGLRGLIRSYADQGIYTTFTGIGLDANAELIEALTQIRGANAYFVNSEEQFKRRLNEEFTYMVTPLAFDVRLTIDSPGFEIVRAFGTGGDDASSGTFIDVPTFFPSPTTEEGGKGSILLAKVRPTGELTDERRQIRFRATYAMPDGSDEVVDRTSAFPEGAEELYTSESVRKGVALVRLGDVLRAWADSAYRGDDAAAADRRHHEFGVIRPLSTWERRSTSLFVTAAWKQRIRALQADLKRHADTIPSTDFARELELLARLLAAPHEPS